MIKKIYLRNFYAHCPHCGGGFTTDITSKPQRTKGVGHVEVKCPCCSSVFVTQTA